MYLLFRLSHHNLHPTVCIVKQNMYIIKSYCMRHTACIIDSSRYDKKKEHTHTQLSMNYMLCHVWIRAFHHISLFLLPIILPSYIFIYMHLFLATARLFFPYIAEQAHRQEKMILKTNSTCTTRFYMYHHKFNYQHATNMEIMVLEVCNRPAIPYCKQNEYEQHMDTIFASKGMFKYFCVFCCRF